MVSRREILEHYEPRKMLQSILEILQLYHAQSRNLNRGKCLNKRYFHISQNKFREKDPNDIHQKTKVRLNTLNNG